MEWRLGYISREELTLHVGNTINQYGKNFFVDPKHMCRFHIGVFGHIGKCRVDSDGWDVIYRDEKGILLPNGETVHTIYAVFEPGYISVTCRQIMAAYEKMVEQIDNEEDCACFVVETNPKKSQDLKWTVTIKGKPMSNERIRRISIDCFYVRVTEDRMAFDNMCHTLPDIITGMDVGY